MISAYLAYIPSAIILYVVGLIIFLKRGKNPSHTFFFLICYAAATREVLLTIEALNPNTQLSTWLVRFSFLLIAPCCAFLFYFCQYFPDLKKPINRKVLFATVILIAAICILSLSNYLVPIGQKTKLYMPSVVFYYGTVVVYFIASLDVLNKKLKASNAKEKNQIRLIMVSIGIVIIVNLLEDTLLVPFGKDNRFTNFISGFSFALLGSATAYAMIKHRFFDIRSAVARSSAYTLLFGTLAGAYLLVTFVIARFSSTASSGWASYLITFCIGAFVALSLAPTKRLLDRLTNRLFYRDGYDMKRVVEDYQDAVDTLQDSDEIITLTKNTLQKALRPAGLYFEKTQSAKPKPYEFSWKITHQQECFGELYFGEKLSGASYSAQDKKLIKLISATCAISLQNTSQFNEIKQFANTLKKEVDVATKKLVKTNKHLEALSTQKDEFISMASHQLRPQLTAIGGFIDLLKDSPASLTATDKAEILELMSNGTRRMTRLVSDMLHSNVEDVEKLNNSETFDIVSLIEDETRLFKAQTNVHGIEITLRTIKPTFVIGNPFQTKEILLNLLDNAVAYSPPNSKISIAVSANKGTARIAVTDKGIGIKKSEIPKIFDKFYRSKDVTSKRPTGTGVGLFVAKKFAENQGGAIGVSSVYGKHSTFWFTIPLVS